MTAWTGTIRDRWRDATGVDAAWIVLFSILFYASKWTGKLIDEVPGHSGAFWIPALLLSAVVVRRPGSAALTSLLGAAFWCFPRGGGLGALAPYVVGGVVVDFLVRRDGWRRSLAGLAATGAACHLGKFFFHNVPKLLLGVPADFLIVGLLPVLGLHLLFGAIGGSLAWGTKRALRLDSAPRP